MAWIGFKQGFIWLFTLLHPFFIAVVEIDHNPKEASLEISVRTFTDDLEKMIQQELHVALDLNNPKQKDKADQLIHQYIQNKINLTANGKPCTIQFVGFEIQKESTWSYFEVKDIKQLKQLQVFCELLFGVDPQQINIVHVKANGVRKSHELAAPKNTIQFTF